MVLVIIRCQAKQPVATFFIQGDGCRVVLAHFQSKVESTFLMGIFFRSIHKLFPKALATKAGIHGNGIQTRQPGAGLEQNQGIASQFPFALYYHQSGMLAL